MKSAEEVVRDLPLSVDADLRARASVLLRLATGLRRQRDDAAALGFSEDERQLLSSVVLLLERAELTMREATGIARTAQVRRNRRLEDLRPALQGQFGSLAMVADQIAFIAWVYGDGFAGLDIERAAGTREGAQQLLREGIEQLSRRLARVDMVSSPKDVALDAWETFTKVRVKLIARHAGVLREIAQGSAQRH